MIIGYARTSTLHQVAGFEAQVQELQGAGCEKLFQEQASTRSDRPQLRAALEFVRDGDVFVVTRLDRLARSVADLMGIIDGLERKRVGLRILNLGMDTQTPTGRASPRRRRRGSTRDEGPWHGTGGGRSSGWPPRA